MQSSKDFPLYSNVSEKTGATPRIHQIRALTARSEINFSFFGAGIVKKVFRSKPPFRIKKFFLIQLFELDQGEPEMNQKKN